MSAQLTAVKKGYAYVPVKPFEDLTEAEREAKPTSPEPEAQVTQEDRQKTFDNQTTTDDHLMHLVGLAHDQAGNKFYYTKNSWGTDIKYDGYLYMSRSYVRLKVVAIMVHKASIPAAIAQKLGLK
jgi:bleomycin hydrolase